MKGVKGEADEKRRQYIRTTAERILRIMYPRILRSVLSQITRIECLRYKLVFSRQTLDAYNYTDTPCGQFIEPLSGDYGASEIVAAAQYEISRGEVYGIDVFTYDFGGIRKNLSEAIANRQTRD